MDRSSNTPVFDESFDVIVIGYGFAGALAAKGTWALIQI